MERCKPMKRGVITVYLSLILTLMIGLFSAVFYSARIAAGRVLLGSAAEQSLFSLFSEYDSDFFERYGIMGIQAGTTQLDLASIPERLDAYAEYVMHPKKENPFGGLDMVHMEQMKTELLGFSVLTDHNGNHFYEQIMESYPARKLRDGIFQSKAEADTMLGGHDLSGSKQAISYLDQIEHAVDDGGNIDENEQENAGGAQIVSDFTREDQSRAENIHFDTNARPSRGFLRDLLQRGLFSAALPPGSEASTFCANEGALLSERKRTVGVGFAAQNGVDIVEKGTAISYALDLLPSFTNPKETEGYQYQVEYLIGGQAKDADNLETVLQRILLIREAANYFFLAKDPQKRAESYALASALCTALLIPAAVPAVAMGIRAAWAYLESISDVRALLEGKRVPMLKSAMTWKTSPNAFASASAEEAVQNGAGKDNGGKDGGGEQGSGSAYTDYLAMLLIPMDAEQLMLRMCTMMEQTMRNAYHRDGFSLDRLVTEVRAEFKGKIDQKELFCSRYYHYGKRSTA